MPLSSRVASGAWGSFPFAKRAQGQDDNCIFENSSIYEEIRNWAGGVVGVPGDADTLVRRINFLHDRPDGQRKEHYLNQDDRQGSENADLAVSNDEVSFEVPRSDALFG